jgi:CRP/FNR family transcriptional regulator, putaive post-exponential-phase nitrogen-starvation regulator
MVNLGLYIHDFKLDEHLNSDLLRCLRRYQFPPQTEIYAQAAEQTRLYFLVSGQAQVYCYHPNGKISILALLSPLAVIGDLELFSFDNLQTNVITVEHTVLLGIEKEFVVKYGYNDPRFLRFIIHHLTTKLYETSLIQLGNGLPLINRLATYLLTQSPKDGLVFPSKPHLAALLGTTHRHLNRVLKTLESEGLIYMERQSRRILILNPDGLRRHTES